MTLPVHDEGTETFASLRIIWVQLHTNSFDPRLNRCRRFFRKCRIVKFAAKTLKLVLKIEYRDDRPILFSVHAVTTGRCYNSTCVRTRMPRCSAGVLKNSAVDESATRMGMAFTITSTWRAPHGKDAARGLVQSVDLARESNAIEIDPVARPATGCRPGPRA